MQILQDTKSSSSVQPASDVSDAFLRKGLPNNPDRDVMCLVFPDGSVRTVNPDQQSS